MKTEINSPMGSKINFTAIAQFALTAVAAFGFNIDADTQVKMLTTSGMIGPTLVWIFRTWFTDPK